MYLYTFHKLIIRLTRAKSSIGQCIAYLSVNLPKEKVTIVENAQIIKNAKLWREANGVGK